MAEYPITQDSYKNGDATSGARCLFVCTTGYNASVLRLVASALHDWDCWFSPVYSAHNLTYRFVSKLGIIKHTTLNPYYLKKVIQSMEGLGLRMDIGAKNSYDLIVLGNDFYMPQDLRSRSPKVLVQEGWVWTKNWRRWLCEHTFLPPWFAVGDGIGLSRNYDYFCVASQGYKELFKQSGIDEHRLVVTGLPTLDAVEQDFAHFVDETRESKFVLVTTHPSREYFEGENRKQLLMKARRVAKGFPIVVKLHPNEDFVRATREIAEWLPEAKVVVDVDVNYLIANCSALVTTYSTTIYYALLLGKDVYCSYPTNEIRKLLPEQNGQAAHRIAKVCRTAVMLAYGMKEAK